MSDETLVNRANGQVIDQDFFNLINRVLQVDLVGRNSAGAATAGQNLGTVTVPWGTARITNLILNGSAVDPGLITASPNRIVSGAIRATSNFPDFLRPAGVGNGPDFDLLATAVNLSLDVNGVDTAFIADDTKAGLTVAPAANNTCLINDTTLIGQDTTKNLGEDGSFIIVDNMGSELTSKVGEYVALLNQTSNEIMYAYIESTIKLSKIRRGFFLNSAGTPIVRAVLNNNEVLQILSLAFIFADQDGSTIDVTYRNPVEDGNEPVSAQTGDYWKNLALNQWERFDGADFQSISRTFIGYAVVDTVDCIGTRSEYFSKSYSDENTIDTFLVDVDTISIKETGQLISIDGREINLNFSFFEWLAGSDFESGVIRTVSINYWLYITEDGKSIISDKKPYDETGFLKGFYHPFESWLAVAKVFNNSSDQFELVQPAINKLRSTVGFFNGASGHGSAASRIPYFTNEIETPNRDLLTIVNDSTNGHSITAKVRGELIFSETLQVGVGEHIGISKNSTQLTTNIQSININDRIGFSRETGSNDGSTGTSDIMEIGDIIRPHDEGTANGASAFIKYTFKEL